MYIHDVDNNMYISFELPSHIHRSLQQFSDTTKTLVECHIGDTIHHRRNKIDTEMIEVESLYFCVTHYSLGDMQDCSRSFPYFRPLVGFLDNSTASNTLYNSTLALKHGSSCIYRAGSEWSPVGPERRKIKYLALNHSFTFQTVVDTCCSSNLPLDTPVDLTAVKIHTAVPPALPVTDQCPVRGCIL